MRHHRWMPDGPERELEQAVVAQIPDLFGGEGGPRWIAGSVPIGAGVPDILIAEWQPDVLALKDVGTGASGILACLRHIHRARIDTLARRLRQPEKHLSKGLTALRDVGAVLEEGGSFRLAHAWKSILPEVISIEVKVSNWRAAVAQAARNSVLAHHSLVAMPEPIAKRIAQEAGIARLGLGVLGICSAGVKLLRRPRRRQPKVWSYYYQIAQVLAIDIGDANHALRRIH